jgi:hypothetical protein
MCEVQSTDLLDYVAGDASIPMGWALRSLYIEADRSNPMRHAELLGVATSVTTPCLHPASGTRS